ncbi:hypothetical protein LWI28_019000 [Acer negundo]|uniref:Apple domain-containing protein n=1 Tax=Acer negundo TaxID=4023 RepID=A0AAD5J6B0_ACENE|nr:hypothetical protein LWI28_019000 [Acer negundo]
MKLGWNLRTGFERYLTPWRCADDPSPGDFSLRLDIHGPPQLVITTGSRKDVRSRPWNGRQFGGIPILNLLAYCSVLYGIGRQLSGAFCTLGHLICVTIYAQCGSNNNCRINKTPSCDCLKGFIPKAEDEWDTQGLSQSRKCIEKSSSDCPSGEGFLKLRAIKLTDFSWYNNSMNINECEAECFKNCSCRAYANSDVSGGSGCLMLLRDLIDIRECPPEFSWGQDIFLRVPASELALWYKADVMEVYQEAVASGAEFNTSDAFTINCQPGALFDCSTDIFRK